MEKNNKVLVTPEFAASQLKVNESRLAASGKQQRHITPSNLASLRRNMLLGTFTYPQDRPIAFTGQFPEDTRVLTAKHVDISGSCLNGGHRLLACQLEDKAFYADVWYNCPVELIEIFDMGKARDDRDHLEISHSISHKQSAFIKSIYVRAIQYIRDGDPFSQQHVTRSEMDDYASRYVDILKDAVSVADRSIGYKAVYGMLYFIAAKNGYKQEVESFISSVQEGTNLENGTPAHLLHKRFYLNKQTRQAATRSPRHATLWAILAFRRHILGEPLHNFNVREGFDLPDGTGGLLTSA